MKRHGPWLVSGPLHHGHEGARRCRTVRIAFFDPQEKCSSSVIPIFSCLGWTSWKRIRDSAAADIYRLGDALRQGGALTWSQGIEGLHPVKRADVDAVRKRKAVPVDYFFIFL